MKKNIKKFIKKSLIFLIIATICVSILNQCKKTDAASDTNIQNGSFEEKEISEISEATISDNGNYAITDSDNILNWKTTATDNKIEIGEITNGKSIHMLTSYQPINLKADGMQYAELNANEEASLYQNISTNNDSLYIWSIIHRGRGDISDGQDVMAVIIGNKQMNEPDKNTAGKDQYMLMMEWIKENVNPEINSNSVSDLYEIYSKPFSSGGEFEGDSNIENFCRTKDDIHTELWKVRLISSGISQWYSYRQEYRATSDNITFALTSYSTMTHKVSMGNIIDNIKFQTIDEQELLKNGSFEQPKINSQYSYMNAANATEPAENIGWSSTAKDKKIEIGSFIKGSSPHIADSVSLVKKPEVYVPDGKQYAELNANQESSLYQYINVMPKKMYKWGLYHRGRYGIDTMALIMGQKQKYDPKKTSASGKDQLMRIVQWIQEQPEIDVGINLVDFEPSACSKKIVLYSTPFADNGEYENDSNPFSWTKDENYTEQWNVWIMSSECAQWHGYGTKDENIDYDNTYYVPEGVNETIFSFVSYNSYTNNGSSLAANSNGNLIDGIDITGNYKVECYTTPTGSGTYTYLEDYIFTYDSNYVGYVQAYDTFSISTYPQDQSERQRSFLGARINGEFIKATSFEMREDGKLYYESPAVLQHYEVRLIFAAEHIIYDSNRWR